MRQYGYNSTTVDPMGMYIHQVNSSQTASKQWKSVKVRTECPLYEDQASPNIQDHEIVKEIGSLIGKHLMDSVCGTKEDKLLLELYLCTFTMDPRKTGSWRGSWSLE